MTAHDQVLYGGEFGTVLSVSGIRVRIQLADRIVEVPEIDAWGKRLVTKWQAEGWVM